MLVLGLDTATPAVSVALVELPSGRVLAERAPVDPRRHGELLAVAVREVLAEAGVDRGALHGVVAGLGPGPFTGLRVGVVTGAALGDALGIPVVGRCSLDALAAEAGEPVVAVTDARRREVYWAGYDGAGRRTSSPSVEAPAALAARLAAEGDRRPLVGAGALDHPEAFAGREVRPHPRYPSAAWLVQAAAADLLAGTQPGPLQPLYLRRPDAQELAPR